MERRAVVLLFAATVWVLVWSDAASADAITFDFSEGIGPNFTAFKSRDFWIIATDTTGLRISKPADDGSSFAVPDTRSGAELASVFAFDGDFAAALDFSWNLTATPSFSAGDNSASFVLLSASDPTYQVAVSSVSLWDGTQRIDVGYSPPLAHLFAGTAFPTPLSGTLEFTRVGSVLTLSWNSNLLNTLALPPQLQGPVGLRIVAHQGQGWGHVTFTGIDPRDAMDVSFATLDIEAEAFEGVIPEPGSILLFGMGVGALGWRYRRRRNS